MSKLGIEREINMSEYTIDNLCCKIADLIFELEQVRKRRNEAILEIEAKREEIYALKSKIDNQVCPVLENVESGGKILVASFAIGDQFYYLHIGSNKISGPYTVGRIEISYIDSPGIPQCGMFQFDNYKAQKKREEQYQAIQTGIGSGCLYSRENMFMTRKEAEKALSNR